MEKFVITGGKPLRGEVTISGAKNAAVGILPATILAADVCVVENLPDISDVAVSLKILSVLGAQIKMINRNTYEIDTSLIPDDDSGDAAVSLPSGGDNGGLPENYPYERTTTNGQGEYGKSNPDATGRADLPTMQKVRQELWDMSSSKSSKLTYDDIKEMLGGEDGIPHTGMDEKSWNSEKHAYGWFNGEGDYYVLYFNVQDGNEYYTAATFSSSVRGDS